MKNVIATMKPPGTSQTPGCGLGTDNFTCGATTSNLLPPPTAPINPPNFASFAQL